MHMHTHIHTCIDTLTYIDTLKYTHTYIHTYTHKDTHAHTQTLNQLRSICISGSNGSLFLWVTWLNRSNEGQLHGLSSSYF